MEDLLQKLKQYLSDLKSVKKTIEQVNSKNGQVHSKAILSNVEVVSRKWFDDFKKEVSVFVPTEVIEKYDQAFEYLLKLSNSRGNAKKLFLANLKKVTIDFANEVIVKASTSSGKAVSFDDKMFDELVKNIKDKDQNEYLAEAIKCAKLKLYRASALLGWCACVDMIHKKIEQIGFAKFNICSVTIASETQGRFKRYNSTFNISSISELREVFDDKLLWVLEGMKLIDLNQHTRLKSCLDMRNQCAHPGEAPITIYNLLSFFSDIKEIVINSKIFKA